MEFLYTHLQPGSFRPAYADTDSMCLGLSRTRKPLDDSTEAYYRSLFDPIVRPDMRQSWERQWRSWIVSTDTVEDQRCPGKLKRMSCFHVFSILLF